MGSRPRPAGGTRPGRGPGRRADSDRADPGGGPGRGGPGRRKASAGAKADRCVAAPAPLWDPPAPRPQPAAPWLRSCCGSATGARWACARRSSCRRSPPCWRRAARGASASRACCWSWRGSWCSSGTSVTMSTRCSPTWSSPFSLHKHLCTFISAASKFAQLQYLWRTADSGAVSALTWSLASYTCAARIVTTLMTTSDLTMLTRFVIMLALNIWITATVLRYRVTAEKAE
ncbi:solute carrier family 66 member 3 isoform X2 [Manis javanica]|uniref:solute carrier family 66 member 3 isoform X2 n=1 Tax=Manis javanica TaxID=9974 RepID=UPI003C6D5F41